ncbi:ROK family protein [Neobacillus sp. D3-1R]|uniref:ROK family protein n=1 Tax=Neobacillus sp. D3-1R TaxID=3445778 RepID=UPI003FA04DB6
MSVSIGIDIGGTKMAVGLLDRTGDILYKKVIQTPETGKNEIIHLLKGEINNLKDWANQNRIPDIVGIGIGTAGQIDFPNGRVLSGTTNIRDWNNVELRKEMESTFQIPVWVDNDVNVLLLAEKYLGVARGQDEVICFSLGTGVGGAVITKGEIMRGLFGAAAELGHISIDMHGPDCNCGFKGCLELYASGTGIARMMKDKLMTSNMTINKNEINSRLVFELYHKGNELAKEVIETSITALAFGVVSCIHTFNPGMIILGGGVVENGEWFVDLLKEKLKSLGLQSMIKPVKIVLAKLGPDSGLIGAGYQSFIYTK